MIDRQISGKGDHQRFAVFTPQRPVEAALAVLAKINSSSEIGEAREGGQTSGRRTVLHALRVLRRRELSR
jgi:hypothetical protein